MTPQFDVEGARKAGYSEDEIAEHLAKSNQFDIEGARKSGYSAAEVIKHLTAAKAPSFVLGGDPSKSTGSVIGDVAAGLGAGVFSTVKGATELTRLNKLLPEKWNKGLEELSTAPATTSGSVGKGIEQTAEFLTPMGEEKLIAKLPQGIKWLSRGGLTAARTGAQAAIQSGDVSSGVAPGVAAGGTSLLFGAISPALSKISSKIQTINIRPSAFDIADGFSTETLKQMGLKGNLAQSLSQVENTLAKLRTERNALVAPGKANVDLAGVFSQALKEAKLRAANLKYGPAGKQLVAAIEKMRDDTFEQLGLSGLATKASVDVRKAENLKEYLGTMGAWAHGGGDPAAKITEEAANSLYTGVKNGIEAALGTEGPRVQALNREMGKLIPVKHAMVKRIPVEQRQNIITLRDLAATLPAVITGDVRHLTIEGLNRAQQSLRFGNWLGRNAARSGVGGAPLGRAVGAAVSETEPSPRNRLGAPE